VFEGRCPCPPKILPGKKYKKSATQWREVSDKSALCITDLPASGIAAQWRVQVEETPVTFAVWHGGRRQLTPPDTVLHPPHTAE